MQRKISAAPSELETFFQKTCSLNARTNKMFQSPFPTAQLLPARLTLLFPAFHLLSPEPLFPLPAAQRAFLSGLHFYKLFSRTYYIYLIVRVHVLFQFKF